MFGQFEDLLIVGRSLGRVSHASQHETDPLKFLRGSDMVALTSLNAVYLPERCWVTVPFGL